MLGKRTRPDYRRLTADEKATKVARAQELARLKQEEPITFTAMEDIFLNIVSKDKEYMFLYHKNVPDMFALLYSNAVKEQARLQSGTT